MNFNSSSFLSTDLMARLVFLGIWIFRSLLSHHRIHRFNGDSHHLPGEFFSLFVGVWIWNQKDVSARNTDDGGLTVLKVGAATWAKVPMVFSIG